MEGAGGGGSEASYEVTDFGEAKRAHDKGGTHDTPQKKLTGVGGRVGAEACRLPRPCRLKTDLTHPTRPCPVPSCYPPPRPLPHYPTRASITRHRGGDLTAPFYRQGNGDLERGAAWPKVLPRLGTGALLLRSAGDRGAQRLRAPGGGGWDGAGPCLRPGYGVPYLARRGWQARSSARRRCWWPHTHICPGLSLRCSQSAGPLWGEGREFAQSGEVQGCSEGSPRAPPGPALVLAGPERQTKELR